MVFIDFSLQAWKTLANSQNYLGKGCKWTMPSKKFCGNGQGAGNTRTGQSNRAATDGNSNGNDEAKSNGKASVQLQWQQWSKWHWPSQVGTSHLHSDGVGVQRCSFPQHLIFFAPLSGQVPVFNENPKRSNFHPKLCPKNSNKSQPAPHFFAPTAPTMSFEATN